MTDRIIHRSSKRKELNQPSNDNNSLRQELEVELAHAQKMYNYYEALLKLRQEDNVRQCMLEWSVQASRIERELRNLGN